MQKATHGPAGIAAAEASLESLNKRQREAASCGNGPLLIIAGAGTGKTTTLAHRVAYQIATGVDPGRILLLTFTRRAAGEMLRRVESLLRIRHSAGTAAMPPRTKDRSVWGGTFHATATRLLRLHGRSIGLDPGFTILDRTDAEDLMNFVRTELGLSRRERRFPQKATCFDIYSRCVDTGGRLEPVLESAFPWCRDHADDLRALFGGYVDRKAEQSVLDYDDLLLFWRGLLRDSVAGEAVRARFDRVLVDEYQDTNALQAEIVGLLRPDGTGVTVVGDDAQSIYSFRAATVRNILDFPSQFADTTVITLERNYRSTAPLLDVTNRVIAQAGERYEKNLWTDRAQGEPAQLVLCEDEDSQTGFLVETILDHREAGLPLRRQAVLFRASHHSLALELELGRRDIPFVKYGGLKFVEMAHVKDLLAFLRVAENPRDQIAGMRALLLVPGIGPARARELTAALVGAGMEGPFEAWATERPPAAAAESWPALVELLTGLSGPDPGGLPEQISRIRAVYAPLLERAYDNAAARLRDLEQIEHLAAGYPDRTHFLAEITLDPPSYTGDLAGPPYLDEDYLILSTMHSAKGLEWDAVYVIHAADGNIPSDMATGTPEQIDEELRLFYVALTRAKDWLYVCCPLRYYPVPRRPTDSHGYAQLTRFISPSVRPWFEERVTGMNVFAGAGGAESRASPQVTVADIRTQLKGSW